MKTADDTSHGTNQSKLDVSPGIKLKGKYYEMSNQHSS